jgi:DNA invertase Pin-like site-specific DNA recombinase
MARYGYIRLDNQDPDVARQASQLDSIGGFDKIFVEKRNFAAKQVKIPDQLDRAITLLAEGDILYVASLDRFCNKIDEFIELTDLVLSKGADLVCLESSFDTRNPASKTSFRMIKSLYEIDTRTMSRKKKEGIRIAKENGKRIGRPSVSIPVGFRKICQRWAVGEISGIEAIRLSEMKSTTFYSKAAQMGFVRTRNTVAQD